MNEETVNKVIKVSRNIENFLNNNALHKFAILHGIDPKYSKFHLKQEVIADRSLFFDVKKKYSLHIINKNGRSVNEFFNRGIDVRRSDFPSYTKECLSVILDMILNSEKLNIKNIIDYVNDTTNVIRRMIMDGDKRIARPVSCKRDDRYKNGILPSHAKGMKLWNSLEYEYFVEGTKGYQFKITGVDPWDIPEKVYNNLSAITEKHNNIAIPFEEPKLPSYYMIDTELMLQFAWIDRYTSLLKPILEPKN